MRYNLKVQLLSVSHADKELCRLTNAQHPMKPPTLKRRRHRFPTITSIYSFVVSNCVAPPFPLCGYFVGHLLTLLACACDHKVHTTVSHYHLPAVATHKKSCHALDCVCSFDIASAWANSIILPKCISIDNSLMYCTMVLLC